jgi:hypothetical protein
MSRFLLIDSIPHYREIARAQSELLETHGIITADLGAAMLLEDEGRAFVELWDYLSDADIEENLRQAWSIHSKWHGLEQSALECFGAHPLKASAIEMLLPSEIAINASMAFSRFMKAERPSGIIGAGRQQAIIRNGPPPVYQGTAAIAEAVVCWHCVENRIDFTVRGVRPPKLKKARRAPLLQRKMPMAPEEPARSTATDLPLLMLLDLVQNPDELYALESELARQRHFRVVRVSEPRWRQHYPLAPRMPPSLEAAIRSCSAASARARQEYRGPHPYLFANRYLEYQFLEMWNEVRRSCQTAAFVEPILRFIRPDALLLGADCFTREGLIRDIAMYQGIVVGVLVHGGLAPRRGWQEVISPADVTFTWGEVDRKELVAAGADASRLSTIGSLRYHELCASDGGVRRPTPAQEDGDGSLRSQLGLTAQSRIVSLLTGPINLGLGGSYADAKQHRSALREIVQWARENPATGVILKPHPNYDHHDCYGYMSERFPPNMRVVEGVALRDVVAITDVAVLLNYCTTAGLEAMAHVPLVFARQGYRNGASAITTLDGEIVLGANSVAELAGQVEKLASGVARQDALERQRVFLTRAICNPNGEHPASSIATALENFLRNSSAHEPSKPTQQQAVLRNRLWREDAPDVVSDWGELVSTLSGERRTGFLLATAIVLSTISATPVELAPALAAFTTALRQRAGGREVGAFVLGSGLSAMMRAQNGRRWLDVVALAGDTLRRAPRRAATSPLFWLLAARAALSYGVTDVGSVRELVRSAAFAKRS